MLNQSKIDDYVEAIDITSIENSRLESLSNEILLDIAEYLDAYDLYTALYGLNVRFNNILRSAKLKITYDESHAGNKMWYDTLSNCDPSKIQYILHRSTQIIPENFLSSSGQCLRALVFQNITYNSIEKALEQLPDKNRLQFLFLFEVWNYNSKADCSLVELLFRKYGHRLTSLTDLLVRFSYYPSNSFITPIIFSNLRRMSLNKIQWTDQLCQIIQNNIPNLRSLKITGRSQGESPTLKYVFRTIKEFHIEYIDHLEGLFRIFSQFPSLRRLHVAWQNSRWSLVADGNQWAQVIEKSFPNLEQLTNTYDNGVDEEIVKTFYNGEFWSRKKVRTKTTVNKITSRYRTINKIIFGQEWYFGYYENYSKYVNE